MKKHNISVYNIEARFNFFLALIFSMGCLSIFYEGKPSLAYILVGLINIFSSVLGFFALKFHTERLNISFLGFILASSIYLHSALQLTEIVFFGAHHVFAQILSILVWTGFGFLFMMNWEFILEPFLRYNVNKIAHSNYDRKKIPPCIGCREISKEIH